MKVIKDAGIYAGKKNLFFDVDGTLVDSMLGCRFNNSMRIDHSELGDCYYRPINCHIQLLKQKKREGYTIIVWSVTGYEWASLVVKALKLTKYVDVCMSKPSEYVDDKDINKWIGKQIYLGDT